MNKLRARQSLGKSVLICKHKWLTLQCYVKSTSGACGSGARELSSCVRASRERVRTSHEQARSVWYPTRGTTHQCQKYFQQYGDKARSSITTELHQLVDKTVFTSEKAWRLPPEQMKSAIRSSMFLKKKFTPERDFRKLKSRLGAGGDQQGKALQENVSSATASMDYCFYHCDLHSID